MSEYVLTRIKRPWVPEWLWRALGQLPTRFRFIRWATTNPVDEFTSWEVNGGPM